MLIGSIKKQNNTQFIKTALKDLLKAVRVNIKYDPAQYVQEDLLYYTTEGDLKDLVLDNSKTHISFQGFRKEKNLRVSKDKVNDNLFKAAYILSKMQEVTPTLARKVLEYLMNKKPGTYKRITTSSKKVIKPDNKNYKYIYVGPYTVPRHKRKIRLI